MINHHDDSSVSMSIFSLIKLRTYFSVVLLTAVLTLFGQLPVRADGVQANVMVGPNPQFVALSPDGGKAYVANNGGSTISVIDTSLNQVTNTIFTPSPPLGVAVTPDGSQLWVTLPGSNSVAVYSTSTLTLVAGFAQNPIPVGSFPFNIAFTPGGGRAFVTNYFSNNVSVIKVANGNVIGTRGVGPNPAGVAVVINPVDGTNAVFVANFGGNTIDYFNAHDIVLGGTVLVGSNPYGVAASLSSNRVFVTNGGNKVSVFEFVSGLWQVTSTITVGNTLNSTPRGIAVRNTGTGGDRLYVAINSEGTVWKIKPSGALLQTIGVGMNPIGVATTPFGNIICVANAASNTVSIIDANINP